MGPAEGGLKWLEYKGASKVTPGPHRQLYGMGAAGGTMVAPSMLSHRGSAQPAQSLPRAQSPVSPGDAGEGRLVQEAHGSRQGL